MCRDGSWPSLPVCDVSVWTRSGCRAARSEAIFFSRWVEILVTPSGFSMEVSAEETRRRRSVCWGTDRR